MRKRERMNVWVCRVSSLGMLSEGLTEGKRKHGMQRKDCLGKLGEPSTPIYLIYYLLQPLQIENNAFAKSCVFLSHVNVRKRQALEA
jgi:hypothetical protein